MPERVVLIGCGGIGSQLAGPLTRYLANRPVPQPLLVTNLMVASAMLSALWAALERGSVPYSEVYLDVAQCAVRPRRWIRLREGEQ